MSKSDYLIQNQMLMEDIEMISVEDAPIPKDGKEYLTRNDNQGGIYSLVRWNKLYHTFYEKGEIIGVANAGTHWANLPK